MSAAAAPLLLGGPPGWLVFGVITVATVGAVYVMSETGDDADKGADEQLNGGSFKCAGNCVLSEEQSQEEEDAESGREIDPSDKSGRRTRAGRAAEKHGSRPGSAFPPTTGNADSINDQGQEILEGIVSDPGRSIKNGNRFGGYDVTAPSGRGARFDSEGKFRGFLEP